VGAFVLAGLWRLGPGTAAVAALVVAAAAVAGLGRRRLGGFTGDVLGACGVVGETAGLLVAAARW
jgi:adenosylcobinamide-GDP ribazoletransferase